MRLLHCRQCAFECSFDDVISDWQSASERHVDANRITSHRGIGTKHAMLGLGDRQASLSDRVEIDPLGLGNIEPRINN